MKLIKYNDFNYIFEWIIGQQNDDGGFNLRGSDIQSTYYAIESLNCINKSLIKNKKDILDFITRCKTFEGVFAYTPISHPAYIESIYSGVKIFELLGKTPENKESIVDFVLKLQNSDGGFRRSIILEFLNLNIHIEHYIYLKHYHIFNKPI